MKQKFLLIWFCFLSLLNAAEISQSNIPQPKKLVSYIPAIPNDICYILCKAIYTGKAFSREETAHAFKDLICIDKSFKNFFYDSDRLRHIIKEMSHSFDCSNETIVTTLSFNKTIRELGRLQASFFNYCRQDIHYTDEEISLALSRYKKDGVDVDFTYTPNGDTALMSVLTKTRFKLFPDKLAARTLFKMQTDFGQEIIKHLVRNNTNLHHKNHQGTSAYDMIFLYHQDLVSFLLHLDKFEPNKKSSQDKTPLALLHLACSFDSNGIDRIIECAQALVQNGANPECEYKIPLLTSGIAVRRNNPRFVEFMEGAIAKKHATQ